jgi:hypothetical protein
MKTHYPLSMLTGLGAAFIAILCICQSYPPITPPRLDSPVFTKITLSEARIFGTYREAVRLAWRAPRTDSIGLRSFTLIRKLPGDSLFDVFSRSQGIPAPIDSFSDDMTHIGFPLDGYSLVMYKIVALDTLGRPSDTSAPCSLYIAPQPILDTVDTVKLCFRWHSSRISGSTVSYVKLWDKTGTRSWESVRSEKFGGDYPPLYFDACLPDSLKPLNRGTLYYAVFLEAMGPEHQSLKVDSIDVP